MKYRNKICFFFILPTLVFLNACSNTATTKKFFDIPGYFKQEVEYIKTNFSTVSKTSVYNNDSSHQDFKVTDVNWEKEFAIFMECDINRPIYYANMKELKSTVNDTNSTTITYESSSPKTRIQRVKIGFTEKGNQPDFVSIQLEKSDLISVTSIEALYVKGSRYQVQGKQKVKQLGDENHFFVEGVLSK
jgi:hypothetical protein